MADPLFELLAPYFDRETQLSGPRPQAGDSTTSAYLARLSTLSLGSLNTTEPAYLAQSSQSTLRSLQALSKRSHRSVIASTDHLQNLSPLLAEVTSQAVSLRDGIPELEASGTTFAQRYDKSTDNAVLDRRKRALLLTRNIDRVENILELPTLLSTTIGSSSNSAAASTTGTATSGYASALDIHAHVRRLKSLYPESALVRDISRGADDEMENLITVLITGLQAPSLKLAGAMRTVGWLRRTAPELARNWADGAIADGSSNRGAGLSSRSNEEGGLGSVFLVCRAAALRRTLQALEPLKELADQETAGRQASLKDGPTQAKEQRWSDSAQTERYLKRYIEVFREQSFAILSMYKSIFPQALPMPGSTSVDHPADDEMPSALATFAPFLVDTLFDTLQEYLPTVTERASRDSLLTQVLYCARSLGRLGADFGMMLAVLEDSIADQSQAQHQTSASNQPSDGDAEWVQVMKKHRVQANRLELLANGVGSGRIGSSGAGLEIRPAAIAS